MRALVIDDNARAEVARVLAHAEKHHYRSGQPPPGDNEHFVARLGTYRVVFSFTHADDMVWRHLSVSISGARWPHPIAVFMIADLFGFTGYDPNVAGDKPPQGWAISTSDAEHCVVVAQPIAADVARERAH